MDSRTVASGLEGVVVADTVLSHVDGERGELWIAGRRVEDLPSFEEAAASLWGADPARVRVELGAARARASAALDRRDPALSMPDGMDALRALVARTSVSGDAIARSVELTAIVAVSAAAALDRYLVTVIDHGMNASTFAARVVASTGSDDVSAIVAGIGALKGPLHGGAPGPVLDMLEAIGAPDRARAWLEAELAAGRRIMGMGHRIYRVRDPRAAVLESAIEELERAGIAGGRLALARAVERAAEDLLRERRPDRPLRANVEFYTAVVLDAVGIDRTAFTPTFAIGRVAGWCAHVEEQRRSGRLIRPASRYVGPVPA